MVVSELLLIPTIVTISLIGVFLFAIRRGWIVLDGRELASVKAELQEVRGLLEYEKNERKREREQLTARLLEAYDQIDRLQRQIYVLEDTTSPGRVRVLGIWPNPDRLKLRDEADAIEDSGFYYRALWGEQATRESILRELRIDGYTIIEIGAEGTKEGIQVHDDVLDASFWSGAINRRNVRVALLLACYSDLSIADAFRNAGVRYVVSATGQIDDGQIVRFTRVFYQAYADGHDVEEAFRNARLVMSRSEREKIVLR